jgi:hypothetical protein
VSRWLLGTDILSELRRPKPERKVVAFITEQPLEDLFVSAVTFAEILSGIDTVASVTRRAELNDWLTHKVRPMFAQRVLAVTEDILWSTAPGADLFFTRPRRQLTDAHLVLRHVSDDPDARSGQAPSDD